MKTTLALRTYLTTLLVYVVVLSHSVQAQTGTEDLITPLAVYQSSLSSKARATLDRIQKNVLHQQVRFVRMGNLAKIQKNGQLSFSLPGHLQRLTATATRVSAKSESTYDWYGELLNGAGHVNVLSRDGKITANISVGDRLYEIYHVDNDLHVLLNTVLDPKKPDCANTRSFGPRLEAAPKQATPKGARSGYVNECIGYARILVLFTPGARAAVGDINQTINMCISNFNSCVYNADVTSRVVVELAGQAELNFGESGNIEDDRDRLVGNPTAQQLRNDTRADLVVLLTRDAYPDAYGIAATLNLNRDFAYGIVVANSAISERQTFAHEVGHLYSLRHRDDYNSNGNPEYRQYSHGYKFNTGLFQNCATIMVGGDDLPGSGRQLRFSNPNVSVDGRVTGTVNDNDNARRITETFATVNNFRDDVFRPLGAAVAGPGYGQARQWYTWEAAISCGAAPYTFEWRTSYDGFNYSPVRGTNETYTENLPCPDGTYYYVQVTVRSSDGQTSSGVQSVYVEKQLCNNYYGGRLASVEVNGEKITLGDATPNPVSGSTDIRYYLPDSQHVTLDIIDAQGRKTTTLTNEVRQAGSHVSRFNAATLPAGSYFYRLKVGGVSQTKRLIVTH